jgi:hypothetical protein
MANVYAIKSGNWSDPTVWNGGTLPVAGDNVRSNNFTVTINQSINVTDLRNDAQAPAVAGGGFQVTGSGYTITATLSAGTATIMTINMATTGSVTIVGNVNASLSTSNANGITVAGSAPTTINITGTIYGGSVGGSSGQAYGINNGNNNTTVNIIGDVYGGYTQQTGAIYSSNSSYGIICSTGFLNIVGNVYANTGASISCAGTINITGNVLGNNATNCALRNGTAATTLTGSFQIIGSSTNYFPVVMGLTSAPNFKVQNVVNTNGIMALWGFVRLEPTSSVVNFMYSTNATASFTDASQSLAIPSINNVRLGTIYGGGAFVGTLAVPTASAVSYGVAVDNTTGSAILNPTDLFNAISGSTNDMAVRLKNVSTVQTTGDQIQALFVT